MDFQPMRDLMDHCVAFNDPVHAIATRWAESIVYGK